nr:pilus assembly protein N-terminal domain-containing protein [Piscinibacter lacus]
MNGPVSRVPPARASRLVAALAGLFLGGFAAAAPPVLEIQRSHSRLIELPFDVGSIAVGAPGILNTTAISPRRFLVSGSQTGATTLMFFGRKGEVEERRVQVVYDVSALREQLERIDPRIRIGTDPNRNALVLSGTVRTELLRRRALDAALSFVGTTNYAVTENGALVLPRGAAAAPAAAPAPQPAEGEVDLPQLDEAPGAPAPAAARPAEIGAGVQIIGAAGRDDGSTTITRTRVPAAGAPQIIDLLNSEEALATRASQLEGLLASLDPSLKVQEINTVLHIKGSVPNPTLLTRALTLIESFVSNGQQTGEGLRPLSDRGGILVTGNDTVATGRNTGLPAGGTGRQGQGSTGNLGIGASIGQSPAKGNIQQNLSRADAVVIAGGRALAQIKVADQPRIEVQIRIVAVDRDATEALGINWRIDGSRVSIGNLTGNVVDQLPTPNAGGVFDQLDVGAANLVGAFRTGSMSILAFLQAVQQNGAGTSLSEPLLTAVSGEQVSFLVGGEIPIPVSNSSISTNSAVGGTTTTNNTQLFFRQFGIQLYLRPTVLEDGRISLVLDQSISAPDFSRTLTIGGNLVPSFTQRQVQTLTETGDGETWAVAGLITAEDSERLQKVPLIGDLPILGKLFQNKNGRKARNELIITVTARRAVPATHVTPPRAAAPGGTPVAAPAAATAAAATAATATATATVPAAAAAAAVAAPPALTSRPAPALAPVQAPVPVIPQAAPQTAPPTAPPVAPAPITQPAPIVLAAPAVAPVAPPQAQPLPAAPAAPVLPAPAATALSPAPVLVPVPVPVPQALVRSNSPRAPQPIAARPIVAPRGLPPADVAPAVPTADISAALPLAPAATLAVPQPAAAPDAAPIPPSPALARPAAAPAPQALTAPAGPQATAPQAAPLAAALQAASAQAIPPAVAEPQGAVQAHVEPQVPQPQAATLPTAAASAPTLQAAVPPAAEPLTAVAPAPAPQAAAAPIPALQTAVPPAAAPLAAVAPVPAPQTAAGPQAAVAPAAATPPKGVRQQPAPALKPRDAALAALAPSAAAAVRARAEAAAARRLQAAPVAPVAPAADPVTPQATEAAAPVAVVPASPEASTPSAAPAAVAPLALAAPAAPAPAAPAPAAAVAESAAEPTPAADPADDPATRLAPRAADLAALAPSAAAIVRARADAAAAAALARSAAARQKGAGQ